MKLPTLEVNVQDNFKPVTVGLGEAIRRLTHVEWMSRIGSLDGDLQLEREMLLQALNVIPVQIGFDCNNDGIPDTVEIFAQAASTSCCRLRPLAPNDPVHQVKSTLTEKPVVVSTSRSTVADPKKSLLRSIFTRDK